MEVEEIAEVFILPIRQPDGIYLADTKDRLREGPFDSIIDAERTAILLGATKGLELRVVLVGKVRA